MEHLERIQKCIQEIVRGWAESDSCDRKDRFRYYLLSRMNKASLLI